MMRMMRAQYESLAVHDLKEIARARGLRGVSGMKKAELIEEMLSLDAMDEKGQEEQGRKEKEEGREREEQEQNGKRREVRDGGRAAGEQTAGGHAAETSEPAGRSRTPRERQAERGKGGGVPGTPQRNEKGQGERPRTRKPARPGNAGETSERSRVIVVGEAAERARAAREGAERSRVPAAGEEPDRYRSAGEAAAWAQEKAPGVPVSDSGVEFSAVSEGSAAYPGGKAAVEAADGGEGTPGEADGAQKESGSRRSAQKTQQGQNRTAGGRVIMSRSQEPRYYSPYNKGTAPSTSEEEDKFPAELDSGITVSGILEVMSDGYGFIRSNNYLPGENDVYVAPSQIRRFNLKTGDILEGNTRIRTQNEKFSALLYVRSINGYAPEVACRRSNFEDMTPIFPDSRLRLEKYGSSVAMRIVDLLSPIGKGQRGMIVSPPKAGKTTLLKEVAISVKKNYPDMHLIILLIDERPEEVTDIRETVEGPNVEVVYSTFDELPDHHKRVSEMVIERARRLVEHKRDVMILLDSITRLTRAYNLVVPPSGRTLSGGIDPAALHMPKRFFGAARNMREGGSLTILATALVDTGSRMDDVIYEEFKGTGNMELVLDRRLSEKRLFPAIDIAKTSTRREDLLLSAEEMEAINIMRRALNGMKSEEAVDKILDLFARTRSNAEFVQTVKKIRFTG